MGTISELKNWIARDLKGFTRDNTSGKYIEVVTDDPN